MSRLLPIEAYLEALNNIHQRAPQLASLHPILEHSTRCFHLTHDHIIFTLSDGSNLWSLTLPLGEKFAIPQAEIKARITLCAHTSFICEAHYLPVALTLFDSCGNTHPREGILQRAYTPIAEFLRLNCAPSRHHILRTALQNLALSTSRIISEGMTNLPLTREAIQFDKQGVLRLANHPITSTCKAPVELLCEVAIAIYIAGSQPDIIRTFLTPSTSPEEYSKRLRHTLASAEHYGIEALSTLIKQLTSKASNESLCKAMEALSGEPFRPMPLLASLTANTCKDGIVEVVTEGNICDEPHEKIDFGACDELFQSDQIIRYRKGNIWGYAHYDGERIATRSLLIAAYDFVEGRAVVRTQRGYGMIDTSGRMVLNDVWEDVAWYGDENIATACDTQGRWHIFDRLGRQLSTHPADWMGDACEGYIVARKGAKFGYYSTDGQKRTDFIYDEAFSFSEGVALVAHNGTRYHIDTSFHRISSKEEERVRGIEI